jgi:hypothetical protein
LAIADALFGQKSGMAIDLFQPLPGQALAGLAVSGSIIGIGKRSSKQSSLGLELSESFTTGCGRIKDLPEKGEKDSAQGEDPLSTVSPVVIGGEQVGGQERREQELQLGQGSILEGGESGGEASELVAQSGEIRSGVHNGPYVYGLRIDSKDIILLTMRRTLPELEKEYRRLAGNLANVGYITQGSVFERKKGPGSRFQWTWKNKQQKTESLTLTGEQYHWLKQAVTNQRRLNKTLAQMRRISEQMFQSSNRKTKRRK